MKIELKPGDRLEITFTMVETGTCTVVYGIDENKQFITIEADMPNAKNNGRAKTYSRLL